MVFSLPGICWIEIYHSAIGVGMRMTSRLVRRIRILKPNLEVEQPNVLYIACKVTSMKNWTWVRLNT